MHKGKVGAVRCCTATCMARTSKVTSKTKKPGSETGLFVLLEQIRRGPTLFGAISATKWTVHGTHLTRV